MRSDAQTGPFYREGAKEKKTKRRKEHLPESS
jgi:hypothetical protein